MANESGRPASYIYWQSFKYIGNSRWLSFPFNIALHLFTTEVHDFLNLTEFKLYHYIIRTSFDSSTLKCEIHKISLSNRGHIAKFIECQGLMVDKLTCQKSKKMSIAPVFRQMARMCWRSVLSKVIATSMADIQVNLIADKLCFSLT